MKTLTCDYCTLRDKEDTRMWITIEGIGEVPAYLCSPSCLVDWAELLDGTSSPVQTASLAS